MRHSTVPLAATLAGLALAWGAAAQAGGPTTSSGCGCLPTSHQVTIPGVTVTPPTTYISPPALISGVGGGGGFGYGSGSGQGSFDVQVSTSQSASADAGAQSYAASVANSQAANLLAASAAASSFGGGGGYVEGGGGVGGSITNLTVVEQGAPAPRQCVAHASVASLVAIQAVCLDDKAVPHPASQLSPDRDVPVGYEGELFRCVAGSHMQYVTAAWKGAAQFDHGQTVVCGKGEALWRSADGRLQCRPQKPARDCNERSLLRRFGAGIKVVRTAADVCTAYGPGGGTTASATPVSGGDFAMDGGVGR